MGSLGCGVAVGPWRRHPAKWTPPPSPSAKGYLEHRVGVSACKSFTNFSNLPHMPPRVAKLKCDPLQHQQGRLRA